MTENDPEEVTWVLRTMRRRKGEPLEFEIAPDDPSAPRVSFWIDERRGRHEVVRVTVEARPRGRGLRTRDLARHNVDRMLRAALTSIGGPKAGTAAYRVDSRPGRPRKVDRDLLEQVARTYKENRDWAPRRAVAEAHDVSLRTASNYIKEARAEGLIQ